MEKRVSSRAIIIKDNKVLLIFRRKLKDGSKKEYYVIPGGGVEENESLEETVKRELKEEVNVGINILGYLGKIELDNSISHYFHCEISNGIPHLGGEELDRMNENNYYEVKWVNLEDIDKIDLTAIKQIKSAINKKYK